MRSTLPWLLSCLLLPASVSWPAFPGAPLTSPHGPGEAPAPHVAIAYDAQDGDFEELAALIGEELEALSEGQDTRDALIALGPAASRAACAERAPGSKTLLMLPMPDAECAHFVSRAMRGEDFVYEVLARFEALVDADRVALLSNAGLRSLLDARGLCGSEDPEDPRPLCIALEGTPDVAGTIVARGLRAAALLPFTPLADQERRALFASLTEAGVATYTIETGHAESGALAGPAHENLMRLIARRVALDLLDVVRGDANERPPLRLAESAGMSIDAARARQLGISLNWATITGAEIVGDDREMREPIDMEDAVRRAERANLDLRARERAVAAGREDVRDARASLGPQVEASLGYSALDDDHIAPSLGIYRRSASWSLGLSQLIYADDAAANVTVQKAVQRARELDRQALELDIEREAGRAYLRLLQSDALVRIRAESLSRARSYLEVARVRRTLGAAGPVEVSRWEAEVATARSELLAAQSTRRRAERALSQLLHVDLARLWDAGSPDLDALVRRYGDARVRDALGGPFGAEPVERALVSEGLERAPELAAADALIEARRREKTAAKRSLYVPQIGLSASYTDIFDKDEGGGRLGDYADLIPTIEDATWSAAVVARLPLTTSGQRAARRTQADHELQRILLERESASESLELRIRASLDQLAYSWPNVALQRDAADAAARTRDVLRDSYRQGAASILDLLDARTATLRAEIAASDAVFAYLADDLELKRALGISVLEAQEDQR